MRRKARYVAENGVCDGKFKKNRKSEIVNIKIEWEEFLK